VEPSGGGLGRRGRDVLVKTNIMGQREEGTDLVTYRICLCALQHPQHTVKNTQRWHVGPNLVIQLEQPQLPNPRELGALRRYPGTLFILVMTLTRE
jgi:hypothetical protein